MPNPVYTTPMVWDPDINPEGMAERINFAVNDQLSLFGNFGQYVYAQFSQTPITGGNIDFANHDGYQFAWQGGVNYKFARKPRAKVAVSLYNYSGFASPGRSIRCAATQRERLRRPLRQWPAEHHPHQPGRTERSTTA